jgi:hypothetical protein
VKQDPVSRVRHTTNSRTTNSQTAAKTKSIKLGSSSNRDIAAALINKGIEKKVAHHLARSYDRQQIENNIDWFEWKQKNNPHSIKTNPAGLLRRAIEQDYASEGHKGFQTRSQQAAARIAQKQHLQAQQRLIEESKQKERALIQQQELKRAKRLETLREQHHTTEREDKLWRRVLNTLREQVSGITYKAYLAQSVLLSLRENQALIAVPNGFVKQWVEQRLATPIQTVLARHLAGREVSFQCFSLADTE